MLMAKAQVPGRLLPLLEATEKAHADGKGPGSGIAPRSH